MKLFVFVVFTLILNFTVRAYCFDKDDNQINSNNIYENTWTKCEMHDVKGTVLSSRCKPRETLVKLPNIPGYENMHPTLTMAMRCGGYCQPNVICSPLKTVMKKVPVRVNKYSPLEKFIKKQAPMCMLNVVEEHKACRCMCKKMQKDCNDLQIFIRGNCACECMNYEDKNICDKQKNMMWDEDTCTCKCNKSVELCSTGLVWVPEKCGCVKMMESSAEYYGI